MTLGKMEVDGGLFQIAMSQQDLNGADPRLPREDAWRSSDAMCGMDLFLDASTLDSFFTRVPGCFRIDG
jgi:hypothetical protein